MDYDRTSAITSTRFNVHYIEAFLYVILDKRSFIPSFFSSSRFFFPFFLGDRFV